MAPQIETQQTEAATSFMQPVTTLGDKETRAYPGNSNF